MARAVGIGLPVSFKHGVEICNFIKNKSVNDAKKMLKGVVDKKVAVPFRRYNWDLGHKRKIGPGRYPEKASKHFIQLIEAVEANAQFKGLNTANLLIAHVAVHKSRKAWHYGRKSRRQMKRSNVEIVVEEKSKKEEKTKSKESKEVKKE